MPQVFKNLFSKKRTLLFLLPVLLLVLFYPFSPAQATWYGSLIGGALGGVAGIAGAVINFVIQFVLIAVNLVFELAAWILNWAAGNPWAVSYTNPSTNPIIYAGWTLLRDLTNMLFILGLAYIGLATALNFLNFDTKKVFPKLILIALLINFTPLICGVLVDVANLLAGFFLDTVDFSPFANAGGFWKTIGAFGGSLGESFDILSDPIAMAKPILMLIYGVVGIIILSLFALLFMFRAPIIWILVCLSPIAFFAWIFPNTKKWFDKWWHWFLQWSFIVVPASFFLYLGQQILANVERITNSSAVAPNIAPATALSSPLTARITQEAVIHSGEISLAASTGMTDPSGGSFLKIAPYFMASFFLMIGLMLTFQIITAAATAVIGAAKKTGKFAKGVLKKGTGAASWAAAAARGAKEGAETKEGEEKKGVFGRIGGAALGAGKGVFTKEGREKGRETVEKTLERYHAVRPGYHEEQKKKRWKTEGLEKKLDGLSDPELEKIAQRRAVMPGEAADRAMAVKLLGKRHSFAFKDEDGNIDKNKETRIVQHALTAGADLSDLAKSRPDLAPIIKAKKVNQLVKDGKAETKEEAGSQVITETVQKMNNQQYRDVQAEALRNKDVFLATDVAKIEDVNIRGSQDKKDAIRENVKSKIVDGKEANETVKTIDEIAKEAEKQGDERKRKEMKEKIQAAKGIVRGRDVQATSKAKKSETTEPKVKVYGKYTKT